MRLATHGDARGTSWKPVLRAMSAHWTYARHRIRHGIRHTAALCRTAPSVPVCRKRPFTTHADRLRPRLKGGRLPVAGPAARRAAPRASTPATSTTTIASGVRDDRPGSTAACARSGRATCSSSGSSTASAAPSPTWSTPCRTCRPVASVDELVGKIERGSCSFRKCKGGMCGDPPRASKTADGWT